MVRLRRTSDVRTRGDATRATSGPWRGRHHPAAGNGRRGKLAAYGQIGWKDAHVVLALDDAGSERFEDQEATHSPLILVRLWPLSIAILCASGGPQAIPLTRVHPRISRCHGARYRAFSDDFAMRLGRAIRRGRSLTIELVAPGPTTFPDLSLRRRLGLHLVQPHLDDVEPAQLGLGVHDRAVEEEDPRQLARRVGVVSAGGEVVELLEQLAPLGLEDDSGAASAGEDGEDELQEQLVAQPVVAPDWSGQL